LAAIAPRGNPLGSIAGPDGSLAESQPVRAIVMTTSEMAPAAAQVDKFMEVSRREFA
jgi:hypothetical protein